MVSNWNEQYLITEVGLGYAGEEYSDPHTLLDCVPTICRLEQLPESVLKTIPK